MFPGKSKSPTAASFIRPTRPADEPQTFLAALQLKYASDGPTAVPAPHRQIVISGKVAEEVGFEKIRRQQSQLAELKIAILDGARVAGASPAAGQGSGSGEIQPVAQVCPKITELDLSRNLFERIGDVVDICCELNELRVLRLKYVCPCQQTRNVFAPSSTEPNMPRQIQAEIGFKVYSMTAGSTRHTQYSRVSESLPWRRHSWTGKRYAILLPGSSP